MRPRRRDLVRDEVGRAAPLARGAQLESVSAHHERENDAGEDEPADSKRHRLPAQERDAAEGGERAGAVVNQTEQHKLCGREHPGQTGVYEARSFRVLWWRAGAPRIASPDLLLALSLGVLV